MTAAGKRILAIDQGTTSTRAIVFDGEGRAWKSAGRELPQIFPRPGWVEHKPDEILINTTSVVTEALDIAGIRASDLAGVGITNQRETTVIWERQTGAAVANAIVWQDTRTAEIAKSLASTYGADAFRAKTGLPPATYFAGPKVRWLLEQYPDLRQRADDGQLAFGTIDSWLAWHLTGRHGTDVAKIGRASGRGRG